MSVNKKFKFLITAIFLFSSTFVYAGWVSGGGMLVKDSRNPWFIQNTSKVKYCIVIDSNHFNQSESIVKQKIEDAIAYWKGQFARALKMSTNGMKVDVATQDFIYESCSESTDLVFQMSFLTHKQIDRIGDPRNYIGLAMRTGYDLKTLKGKGFIYIAADSGPLKPKKKDMIDYPWSHYNGGLLYRVLVHELGHVFGIGHSTSVPNSMTGLGLMSAAYVEYITNKEWAVNLAKFTDLPDYFKFNRMVWPNEYCGSHPLSEQTTIFWGIPTGWKCLKYKIKGDELKVYSAADSGSSMELIGVAALESTLVTRIDYGVLLWLPEEQTVYKNIPLPSTYVYGPHVVYEKRKGSYYSDDGAVTRRIVVDLPLNRFDIGIGGILNGELLISIGY